MRVRSALAVCLGLALSGCPGQGAAPGRAPTAEEAERGLGTRSGSGTVAAPAAAAVNASAAPALPEGLALGVEAAGRDGVGLVIQNRSERPVELALVASVERVDGPSGSTGAVAAASEALLLDCSKDAPRCVALVPGAELRPALWPSRTPRAQCGGGARVAAPSGRYRFVVRGCAAGMQTARGTASEAALASRESEPFEVP